MACIPHIAKPQDRTPGMKAGDLVSYWTYEHDSQTNKRTGKAWEPLTSEGHYRFRGIVEEFRKADSLPDHMGHNHEDAEEGELVIRLLDPVTQEPTTHFERVAHLEPLHLTAWGRKNMTEPEPQRWWPLGTSPNDPPTEEPKS